MKELVTFCFILPLSQFPFEPMSSDCNNSFQITRKNERNLRGIKDVKRKKVSREFLTICLDTLSQQHDGVESFSNGIDSSFNQHIVYK